MIEISPIADCQGPNDSGAPRPLGAALGPQSKAGYGFSMVELLVTMTLLSLIVLVLMAVFNSTQRAFRASVTQTDVLEGGRAVVDLMTSDLRNLAPSDGVSNYIYEGNNSYIYGGVNFFVTNNNSSYLTGYAPLPQTLPGSSVQRTNLLQYFFVLGRENTEWTGAGYVVNSGSSSPLYPLYRFYMETNLNSGPLALFEQFQTEIARAQWTNMSHVMDGVVHLVVRAYDPNGYRMTNTLGYTSSYLPLPPGILTNQNDNVWFSQPIWGEVGMTCYSNAVPASVELQMGILEDRPRQHAETLGIAGISPPENPAQWKYLESQAGHVYVFRERVSVPNVDPTAYQ